MTLSANAIQLLETRYLLRDAEGLICETPEQLFRRSARVAAQGDTAAEEAYFEIFSSLQFLPNSPCLMNADTGGALFACYVLPIEDTMQSIFGTLSNAAMIHKSGGGCGFSFSRLRSKGSMVASTHGVSSGPVSFLRVYNAATEAVKQGGKRRGANMGVLRVDHPDIMEFIHAKSDPSAFKNFNLSVGITDAFMEALSNGGDISLRDPHNGKETRQNAQEIWDAIVKAAWESGEPGILFLDSIQSCSPTKAYEVIEVTNPCGELPLPAYDSCCLGSLILSAFVPSHVDARGLPWMDQIDWNRLEAVTQTAVRFLDALIDVNPYILPEIEQKTKSNRKIGIGVMGWADMLIRLGIPYNSPVALEVAAAVMGHIEHATICASEALAAEKGPFPMWKQSTWERPMRNALLTTVAPTGSISIIAGCSSGIEPLFALSYLQRCLDGELQVTNNDFTQALRAKGLPVDDIKERLTHQHGIQDIMEIPDDIRRVFLVSEDISPAIHIAHQAAFQRYCHSAVSKTVNLPATATVSDVSECFFLAWNKSCKGVTVYRDGSRSLQVLDQKRPRPAVVSGITDSAPTDSGKLYVTLNSHDCVPFEIFCQIGKAEPVVAAETEAIARLVSLALRSDVPMDAITSQLLGIGGAGSIPNAIAEILSRHFQACGACETVPQ